MHCFDSCQSNCGHVVLTSVWERYLSFFAFICPNYFDFSTSITHKEPNCFLWEASPPWNHQYALSLRERLNICSLSSPLLLMKKAAVVIFSKISAFMFRVMKRLMSFSLWDHLLKEGWVCKKCPQCWMLQWSTLKVFYLGVTQSISF